MLRTRTAGTATVAALLTLLTATATACGDGGSSVGGSNETDEPAVSVAPGVPEECADFFAMAPADLGDVDLVPASWPEPPVDATLCVTTTTADNSQESLDYATEATAEEVLSGYETALAAYDVERAEDGLGRPILAGNADGVGFQVSASDGTFSIVFAS